MSDDALIIPIVALSVPIVIVPVALVTKYLMRRRAWQHQERLRALELGFRPVVNLWWPSLAAIAIGAGVPIGCFGVAWLASLTGAVDDEVFIGATFVSIAAVVVGGWMGVKLMTLAHEQAESPLAGSQYANGKPAAFDPESFDVVSRRG